jgi:hypothetical protein
VESQRSPFDHRPSPNSPLTCEKMRWAPRGSNPHWADFKDAASRQLWPLPATMPTPAPPPAPPHATVDVISCHEPCHAAPDRWVRTCWTLHPAASWIAHESGQRFRDRDGSPGLAAVSSDQNGDLLALPVGARTVEEHEPVAERTVGEHPDLVSDTSWPSRLAKTSIASLARAACRPTVPSVREPTRGPPTETPAA